MAYVKGSGRVLREPEVFAVYDDNGRRTYIEVPAGTRVRLNATNLPELPPLPFGLTTG